MSKAKTKMNEQLTPPQDQIDRELTSRTLSNAELIKDGATFETGVLKLTDEQHEDLAQKGDTAKKLGVLVLHSPLEAELDTPTEVLEKEEMNKKQLQDDVTEILTPYLGLFTDKVPTPETNKRNWLGKISEGKEATHKWMTVKEVGGEDIRHDISLFYTQGQQTNNATKAEIRLSRAKAYKPGLDFLRVYFKGGSIEGLKFEQKPGGTDRGSVRGPLSKELPFLIGMVNNGFAARDYLSIDLSGALPTMSIGYNSKRADKQSRVTYEFEPSTDIFKGVYKGDGRLLQELTRDQFHDILEDTLAIIPTIER